MSGTPGTPPADALIEYLNQCGAAEVFAIFHPLSESGARTHRMQCWKSGTLIDDRSRSLPMRPPFTFPLDLLVPLLPPRVDHWIAFNCLEYARGSLLRRLHRVGSVAYWVIDFVPGRFGDGTLATRTYDRLDRAACQGADLRIELSAKARDARDRHHGLRSSGAAPVVLSPIGAWTSRVPVTAPKAPVAPRLLYSGGLDERQGVLLLPDILSRIRRAGVDARLIVTGRGPAEGALRAAAKSTGVMANVEMRGFLSSYADVEQAMAEADFGLAPYAPDPNSFSNFSDLSKLKAYAAAGLPILTTSVPHNAAELAAEAGAEVLPWSADAFADAILQLVGDGAEWMRRRAKALEYAASFDWPRVLNSALVLLTADGPRR